MHKHHTYLDPGCGRCCSGAYQSELRGEPVKHHHCLARHEHKVPAFTAHDISLTLPIQWCSHYSATETATLVQSAHQCLEPRFLACSAESGSSEQRAHQCYVAKQVQTKMLSLHEAKPQVYQVWEASPCITVDVLAITCRHSTACVMQLQIP